MAAQLEEPHSGILRAVGHRWRVVKMIWNSLYRASLMHGMVTWSPSGVVVTAAWLGHWCGWDEVSFRMSEVLVWFVLKAVEISMALDGVRHEVRYRFSQRSLHFSFYSDHGM